MAYNGTLITEAELAFYEGANVAAGGKTEAAHNMSVLHAEAFLVDLLKYDVVANFGTLNTTSKLMLSEYVGRASAITAIMYDLSGFTTRIEAEDMINIHIFRMNEIVRILEQDGVQDFMEVTS